MKAILWLFCAVGILALEFVLLTLGIDFPNGSFFAAVLLVPVMMWKSPRRWRALMAGTLVALGIIATKPSRSDPAIYWRIRPTVSKAFGGMSHVRWPHVFRNALFGGEFEADYFGLAYRGDSRELIDWHVFQYGYWEPDILSFLGAAAEVFPRDRIIFVDVGASSGLHSLYMRRIADQVHAFDPYLPVVERFRKTIEENAISNITLHPVGLGDRNTSLEFHLPTERNIGLGSFVNELGLEHDTLEAEIVVGDDYFTRTGIRDVALIKIDVESFEKSVLAGLKDTLAAARPIVVMELTIQPDLEATFKSSKELERSFPSGYRLLSFVNRPSSISPQGFEFEDLAVDFEARLVQHDIVAIPSELSETKLISEHLARGRG